ncbi:MAG: 6-phosphogluconolactonase [Betaproteobacteria bacterium]|nr:6-phosphogluconolactonase [Betaproteobacteria bacterium]
MKSLEPFDRETGQISKPIKVFPNPEALASAAVDRITGFVSQVLAQRETFHLALSGGTTPRRCYELLRHAAIEWSRIQVYFSDERCLPRGDSGRNDTLAHEALLDHVPIPLAQIHAIHAEQGPDQGAADYARELLPALPLDLVLLGLGEDGHTASLFPDHPGLNSKSLVVPIFDAPKFPPLRVSLSLGVLNTARHKLFLVTGVSKHDALKSMNDGVLFPAARVAGAEWYVDRAALSGAAD